MDGSPAPAVRISLHSGPSMVAGTGKSPERLHRNRRKACVICSSSIDSADGSPLGMTSLRVAICIPRSMEESVGLPILICRFKGRASWQTQSDYTSRERGFVFFLEAKGQSGFAYTTDGGTHWHKRVLPRFIDHCQVFAGDLMCSADPGFGLLTLHPN